MGWWERKSHCWLSDGRLMGFFANPSLDGGLIMLRVVIRYPDKTQKYKQKVIVCKGEFE